MAENVFFDREDMPYTQKGMSHFILVAISVLLITAAITSMINVLYRSKGIDKYNIAKYETMPDAIEICNFGSSHGENSFSYENLDGIDAFNFALGGQTLSYDLRLLKEYGNRIEKGGKAIFVLSYFSFFGEPETLQDGFREKNQRYYGLLPKSLIKDYSYKDAFLYDYPSLTAYQSLIPDLMKGKDEETTEWWDILTADMIDVDDYLERRYLEHIKDKCDSKGNIIVNEEEIDAVNEIISICYDEGITPIFVTTPYLECYNDMMGEKSNGMVEAFYKIVGDIVGNESVEYFDYSEDDRFRYGYGLFQNADHLNHEGALKFTDIVMDEVIGIDAMTAKADKVD